jgi:alpha-amylase
VKARKAFAHGPQTDLFDEPNCIGFIRHGTAEQGGCVVVLSNAGDAAREAVLGQDHAGATFVDFLGHHPDEVVLDEGGKGVFPVYGESVSVWVRRDLL